MVPGLASLNPPGIQKVGGGPLAVQRFYGPAGVEWRNQFRSDRCVGEGVSDDGERAYSVTPSDRTLDEAPALTLDDHADREELRTRYYGLLQELRVVFPGVLVLSAFLLTVPFAQQFHRLGSADRTLFAAGLVSAALSVIAFLTPVWLHRFGRRTERAVRLAVSVIATRVGFVCFLGSLALVMLVVCRFLFDDLIAFAIVGATSALAPVMWGLVPAVVRRRRLALAAMTKSGGDA